MIKKIDKYFEKHPSYNSLVSFIGGIGFGVLITYPFIGTHPLRWGLGLLVLGVLGYINAYYAKK